MKPIFCRQSENVYVKIFITEIQFAVFRFVVRKMEMSPFCSSSDLLHHHTVQQHKYQMIIID